jgi:hypothetical protein
VEPEREIVRGRRQSLSGEGRVQGRKWSWRGEAESEEEAEAD